MEVLEVVLVGPELLSVGVQVINPQGGSRPAVSNEIVLSIRLLHVDVSEVRGSLTGQIFS